MEKFIPQPLRLQLLAEMGYDSREHNCGQCVHHKTLDDPMLDRAWIEACDLLTPTLGYLVIETSAVCRSFTPTRKSLAQETSHDVSPQAK